MNNSKYQPMSVAAVVSLVLAVCSSLSFWIPTLMLVAAIAISVGLLALRSIRHYELGGRRLVKWSLILASTVLIAAPIWWHSAYSAETLPGTVRLNFADVTTSKPVLTEFVGQTVCLKGYVLPDNLDGSKIPITEFSFSFDGNSREKKLPIVVKLRADQAWSWWDWGDCAIAVSGRLEVIGNSDGATEPEFYLTNAVVRRSQTHFDLSPHAPWNGC